MTPLRPVPDAGPARMVVGANATRAYHGDVASTFAAPKSSWESSVRAFVILSPLLLVAAPVFAQAADPRDTGLSWPWLVFGFAAQAVFAARFLVQWISSERRGESVIPTSFWILSLAGGLSLFTYFARRGDPVGMAGQAFGTFVYARNLWLIRKKKRAEH